MQRVVNTRARSGTVRELGLQAHKMGCAGLRTGPWSAILGPKFAGLVHVHDLDPLSLAKERRMTDQVQDCLPLCPKLSSHGALQAAGEQNADQ